MDHARPSAEEVLLRRRAPLVLALENIRSGANVGSILRTADGFGVERVVLAGYTPAPPHREILKTSLGAEASVAWGHTDDLIAALTAYRVRGYRITALEQTTHSTKLTGYDRGDTAGTVVVLGNEVRGVSTAVLAVVDEVIEIDQFGAKQSLNVAVAAGIVAWALGGERA